MNLVNDKWIPVIGQDGKHQTVSLEDVFRDGAQIADLAATPCQRIALMRLLICVAQAALNGPVDEEDWLACRPRLTKAALEYLAKWRDRFNLFGRHAFLQVAALETTGNATADKLDFTLASGNNATLFDHFATPDGRLPAAAHCALNLLVYQTFSPGGRVGVTKWSGVETEKTSEHAPGLEGSMLHTIIRGSDMLATVHGNLLTRDVVEQMPNFKWGKPCWEGELTRTILDNQRSTYLGRLVPVTRAIQCNAKNTKVTLVAGMLYPKLPENREPMGTVRVIQDAKLSYLPVKLEKHPWRELGAILAMSRADQTGGALALAHLRLLDRDKVFDIWTGGLCADKAKLLDMAEWTFSLPANLLDTCLLLSYQHGVDNANSGSIFLRGATKKYAEALRSKAVWQDKAQRLYWATMDMQSSALVEFVVDDNAVLVEKWIPLVCTAMRRAYAQTCPHETPRQIQAYVKGLAVLQGWKGGEP